MKTHPKISPSRDPPPSGILRQCTAAPRAPLAAHCAPVENRGCVRRMSGPSASAEPATPLAGRIDPAHQECLACALPDRPASGFPPVPRELYASPSLNIGRRAGKASSAATRTPKNRPSYKPPEIAPYVAALKQKGRKVVALALRQLLRLLKEYPRQPFLAENACGILLAISRLAADAPSSDAASGQRRNRCGEKRT